MPMSPFRIVTILAATLCPSCKSNYVPEKTPQERRAAEVFLLGETSSARMIRVEVSDDPNGRKFAPSLRNTIDVNASVNVRFTEVLDVPLLEFFKNRAQAIDDNKRYSYVVSVEAYHTPVGGKERRVHVAEYDKLESGELAAKFESVIPTPPKDDSTQEKEAEEKLVNAKAANDVVFSVVSKSGKPLVLAVKPDPSRADLADAVRPFFAADQIAGGDDAVTVNVTASSESNKTSLAIPVRLADAQPKSIVDGRVDLRRIGAGKHDELVIKVIVTRQEIVPSTNGQPAAVAKEDGTRGKVREGEVAKDEQTGRPTGTVVFCARYPLEVVRAGIHPEFAANLVFARADHGPDQQWAGNFAATVDWRWHIQDPCAAGHFLNWLEPGFGFHVASLDQQEDDVLELGIGANASLWGGLLSGGVGYNLNADEDHMYYFIGTDLFKLLQASGRVIGGTQ